MGNELTQYYKDYYAKHGEKAYAMGKVGVTSRVQTLLDWLDLYCPATGRVLDVGCGDAELSKLRPTFDWTGIDANVEQAVYNCRYIRRNLIEHDLMASPYPLRDADYDAVVCSEVLEHVWDPQVVNREVYRVLKPGGYYLLSTPNHYWIDHVMQNFKQLEFDPAVPHLYEHIRFYSFQTHEKFLSALGFKVEDMTGADAQYSDFFSRMRSYLGAFLKANIPQMTDARVDQLIGRCFPYNSHTIMLAARKL